MSKKSFASGVRVALATAAIACLAPTVHAQATRTWVSGVGDDVNPCSRTAPCKTWAGAISKTAAGGEINALDPGGFGALTITKAITIDGAGTQAHTLSSGTNGFIVNVPFGTPVVIRNVSISGAGSVAGGLDGIRVLQGGDVHLENVAINDVTGHGVNFINSTHARLFMSNVSIRNALLGGVNLKPGASGTISAALDRVTLVGNGRGVRAEDGTNVVVRNSNASGNDANGFVAMSVAGRPVDMSIEDSLASLNGAAGVYSGALSVVRLSNTTVTRNADGLLTAGGGQIISAGNNRLTGNTVSNAMPTSNSGLQ